MDSDVPGISVIVPNWNGAQRLPALFASLARQGSIKEVIVVDNGSSDNSGFVAREAGAKVISLSKNHGFTTAVNTGVQAASCEWVAIINNDVELQPGWVETLLRSAEKQSAWFAVGKLFNSRQRDVLDGTFDAICRGGTAWRCGAGRKDSPAFQTLQSIRLAPFTAVLLRKELFSKIGLLDARFESYLEDVDFGLRCAQEGIHGIYVPEAVGFHQGSATLGSWNAETVRRISRNQLFLVAKHYPAGWVWTHGWPVLVGQGLWGLVALRHGAGWAWVKGKFEGIRKFRSMRRTEPTTIIPFPGTACLRARLGVASILAESEALIETLQAPAPEPYWKAYFRLT